MVYLMSITIKGGRVLIRNFLGIFPPRHGSLASRDLFLLCGYNNVPVCSLSLAVIMRIIAETPMC